MNDRVTMMGGTIVMVAVVDSDGSVGQIFSVYGSGLDAGTTRSNARKSARRWLFAPATFHGEPIEYPDPMVFSGGALTFSGWNRSEPNLAAQWMERQVRRLLAALEGWSLQP